MKTRAPSLIWITCLMGTLLVGIFSVMLLRFRTTLRDEIRQTIIERDAAVLRPVALRQLAQRETGTVDESSLLAAVLESSHQENMLGIAVFGPDGQPLRFAPDSLLLPELPLHDYLQLLKGESISRFSATFPLDRYFAGAVPASQTTATPVLEVLLPLHGRDPDRILGFAQYYIDARGLARELATIDERLNWQTFGALAVGAGLIALVLAAAYIGLRRAQREIAERNERLIRTNFELTLAAKASALGQITSHLIHGLQGSVAGLRAVVTARDNATNPASDWEAAAGYTEKMQAMIQETVALLGDASAHASYDVTGHELADMIRSRHAAAAAKKSVSFDVNGGFDHAINSHRGSLLCLIVSNLVDNALHVSHAGQSVSVALRHVSSTVIVTVGDEGPGIPDTLRAHLFEPGRTGRTGGSGLGLAISQLLARQIGAVLALDETGPDGTVFRLTLPLGDG